MITMSYGIIARKRNPHGRGCLFSNLMKEDHIVFKEEHRGLESVCQVSKGIPAVKTNMGQITDIVPGFKCFPVDDHFGHDAQPALLIQPVKQ